MTGGSNSRTIDPERWAHAPRAWVELAALVLAVAGTILLGYRAGEPLRELGCDILRLELAAPASAVPASANGARPPTIDQVAACAPADDLRKALVSSVWRDLAFIGSYGLLLGWCCRRSEGAPRPEKPRGREPTATSIPRVDTTDAGRTFASVAKWCLAAGVLLDLAENGLLRYTAGRLAGPNDIVVQLTAAAAAAKFALVVPAVLVLVRMLYKLVQAGVQSRGPVPRGADVYLPPQDEKQRWMVPRSDPSRLDVSPVTGQDDRYGICLSGGGIRSATFGLGALQVLDSEKAPQRWRLREADYLSAVSGGSYIAATYQFLARGGEFQEPPSADEPLVSEAGPVEGHLRRHSTYLADGAVEWLLAVGEIVIRALSGLFILLTLIWALGVPMGWLYRSVLFGLRDGEPAPTLALHVVAVPLLGLAALLILRTAFSWRPGNSLEGMDAAVTGRREAIRQATVAALAALTLLVLVFPFVSAEIEQLVTSALDKLGLAEREPGGADTESLRGWAGSSALLTVIGGLVAKHRLEVANRPATGPPKRKADFTQKLGFGGKSEVLAGLACFVLLLIATSDVVVDAWRRGPSGRLALGVELAAWQWWLAAVVALALAFVIIDANRWSLRDFYHRRLWLPYAVNPDGKTASWATATRLSRTARKREGFPELLICAAAQTSGRQWAPPGRRALSFVFSGAACGGPDIGYVRTEAMEEWLGARYWTPVTLFGAIGTSGAAFGPAMGRHSKGGLGAVLAIANARLGAWLPNPHHLADLAALHGRRRAQSMSRRPTLAFWFREITGRYPLDSRLVLTTDGGHVENLGLVELLRRRCTRIVCFDASGAGATPTTLAEALIMAREELDVKIELFAPEGESLLDVARFGADPFRRAPKQVEKLADRIAGFPVLVGRIRYPPVDKDGPDLDGVLVYGSLVLTGKTSWDVLEYAHRNLTFPNDGTDKQWFRANTFAAYHQLGQDVATAMLEVTEQPWPWERPRPSGSPVRKVELEAGRNGGTDLYVGLGISLRPSSDS